jgi:hypothetical protein
MTFHAKRESGGRAQTPALDVTFPLSSSSPREPHDEDRGDDVIVEEPPA